RRRLRRWRPRLVRHEQRAVRRRRRSPPLGGCIGGSGGRGCGDLADGRALGQPVDRLLDWVRPWLPARVSSPPPKRRPSGGRVGAFRQPVMLMQYRSIGVEVRRVSPAGTFAAVILRYNVVDDHGTTFARGAFDDSLRSKPPAICYSHEWGRVGGVV